MDYWKLVALGGRKIIHDWTQFAWLDLPGRVVLVNGCFDLLHPGHLFNLADAADLGQHLIVSIDSDENVRRLKGAHRPLMPWRDRAQLLAALPFVTAVTWHSDGDHSLSSLLALLGSHFDLMWAARPDALPPEEVEAAESAGVAIVMMPRLGEWSWSSSALLSRYLEAFLSNRPSTP